MSKIKAKWMVYVSLPTETRLSSVFVTVWRVRGSIFFIIGVGSGWVLELVQSVSRDIYEFITAIFKYLCHSHISKKRFWSELPPFLHCISINTAHILLILGAIEFCDHSWDAPYFQLWNNCFVVLLGNTPLPAMFSCDTWDWRTGRVMYGLEGLTGVYYDVQDDSDSN